MPQKTITEVLSEHTQRLMSLPGVVGTGQGECDGKPCVKVFLSKEVPDTLKQIPSTIEGYRVEVQVTGDIRALQAD